MLQNAPSRNPDGVDALVRRWQVDQDPIARDRLYRQYRPFIWKVTNELVRKHDFDLDETFQWASIGFLRALETYDPGPSALFGYARIWMRSIAVRNLRRDKAAVSPGHSVIGDTFMVRRAQGDMQRKARPVSPETLASATGLTVNRVNNAIEALTIRCSSTETPLSSDGEGDSTLGDLLAATPDSRPDIQFEGDSVLNGARAAIEEAAERVLSPRYWAVIRMRVYDEMTLEEIGTTMGVTRERVRQIEAKALGKLTEALKGDERVGELLRIA